MCERESSKWAEIGAEGGGSAQVSHQLTGDRDRETSQRRDQVHYTDASVALLFPYICIPAKHNGEAVVNINKKVRGLVPLPAYLSVGQWLSSWVGGAVPSLRAYDGRTLCW